MNLTELKKIADKAKSLNATKLEKPVEVFLELFENYEKAVEALKAADELFIYIKCNCPHQNVYGHFSDCPYPILWGSKFANLRQQTLKEIGEI